MSTAPEVEPPDYDALVADLLLLRRTGIVEFRRLTLPALAQAVNASGRVEPGRIADAPAMEGLLRHAIDQLEESRWGRAASIAFGLRPGSRGDDPPTLRREAAAEFGVSLSRWRNRWEKLVLGQLAELMLGACHEHAMRLAHLALERRTPVSTRLAVAWVERFEDYYRLWTPIYALGADLTAYRATLLEPDRPYDHPPSTPEPEGYTQESQAAGYASEALFHLAALLTRIESFMQKHGGLWLLSDRQAESEVADAVNRINVASPMNEEDQSFLRLVFAEVKGELHPFRMRCRTERIMAETHAEWQQFVATCRCQWSSAEHGRNYFPTSLTEPGVDPMCQVHAIIGGANDYCRLIDDDWDCIADWYHLDRARPIPPTEEERYRRLREDSVEKGNPQWPPWGGEG